VSDRHLADYADAKLKWMKIGEEAIVDLATFTTSGRAMKSIRPTINRLEREGYHVEFREPPLDDETIEILRDISDDWLAIGHHRERGFTLGQFDDQYVRRCPVFILEDADGIAVAFINVIPDGAEGEATIDLMRRKSKPDGAMDFLFVRGFERLREREYTQFSLGMAPFANVGRDGETTLPEKGVARLYEHGERIFAYKGLRAYKDKFGPRWEPRYLVYQSEVTLPIVALALTRLTSE
jgi:phosphatidylglycerol lysyltransferase